MKVIAENSKNTKELQCNDKKEYRQTQINHEISKDMDCGLYIYEDKILYIKVNQKEQYGIIIQDKELAELQRRCYSQIWKKSKK